MVNIYKYSENGKCEIVEYNYETELGKKGSEFLNELEKNDIKTDEGYYVYLTDDGEEKVKEFFKKNILNLIQDFLKTIYNKDEDFLCYVESDNHNFMHLFLSLKIECEEDSCDTSRFDESSGTWKYYKLYDVCEIRHEIIIR